MFEGVLFSTIALELLFGWIFRPSELDFEWFLSLQSLFFWVPHRIWRDMCEAFQVEDLALMIRATRGRSRRPNHMHSHLDALQAMGPVNFRRGARRFHSVAKQASFYIAFGARFQGFWKAKWLPKFDFPVFFRHYFSMRLSIEFSWILEAPNQKNSNFP